MLIRRRITNEVLYNVPDASAVGEAVWKLVDQAHERGVMVNLEGADLSRADICCVNLSNANLRGAILRSANLNYANLRGANLEAADFSRADLEGAEMEEAIMPDGRPFGIYKTDPLAGICDEPEARRRAIEAWGNRSWENCPMHAAHGWSGLDDAPADKRIHVAAFVALFDSSKLPKPVT